MVNAAFLAGQAVKIASLFSTVSLKDIQHRSISTNTAIQKGIRQSNFRRERGKFSFGRGELISEQQDIRRRPSNSDHGGRAKRIPFDRGKVQAGQQDRRQRPPRSTFEDRTQRAPRDRDDFRAKQDSWKRPPRGSFEDRMQKFSRGREESRTEQTEQRARSPWPGRVRDFVGSTDGRKSPHDAKKDRYSSRGTRESHSSFGSRYSNQESVQSYEAHGRPNLSSRNPGTPEAYHRNTKETSSLPNSGLPNRAARRASIYGEPWSDDIEKPNEGLNERPPPTDLNRYQPNTSRNRRITFSNSQRAARNRERKEKEPPGSDLKHLPPASIPYTTPASKFLYGTSVVLAALKSSRRKLYKAYVYCGEDREATSQNTTVRKLALSRGVQVVNVEGALWARFLDKLSGGRPHNGYILEASPLPTLPVTGLESVPSHPPFFDVILDHQSREDEVINGIGPSIEYKPTFPRYPFILLLDGILDPGNLGAILRTAFFLGVDAVAISRNSAPLSPSALKASAGACESLPLVSVKTPASFIDASQANGWKFYAAEAVASSSSSEGDDGATIGGSRRQQQKSFTTTNLGCPTQDHPCVLILGGEGEGLRRVLQKKADYNVAVPGPRAGMGGVDSLNVSVAASILCEAFLRPPPNVEAESDTHSLAYSSTATPPSSTAQNFNSEAVGSFQEDTDLVADEGDGGSFSEERKENFDQGKVHEFDEEDVKVEESRLF